MAFILPRGIISGTISDIVLLWERNVYPDGYVTSMDVVAGELFIYFVWSILVLYVKCEVSSIPLPTSLQHCLADKNQNYKNLTDEEAIGTCMMDFMWTNNRRCKGVSDSTMRWFASLAVNRAKNTNQFHFGPKERKEYRMLTDQERNDYHRAVNSLKANTGEYPNKFDAFAIFHQGLAGTAAHRGPAFLGWHRYFLVLYEQALQEEVPGVMLPYWDSTIDAELPDKTDSVIWTHLFLGAGNGSVNSGPFAGWMTPVGELTRAIGQGELMTKEKVHTAINNNFNHQTFCPEIESQHDNVHSWIGGQMGFLDNAPFDPVFYMHHAFIDCIWEKFRERLKDYNIDPENDYPRGGTNGHSPEDRMINLPPFQTRRPSKLNGRYLSNKDGHGNFFTEQYYKCAPFPECSMARPNCGSKWLECNIFLNRCVSKGTSAALPEVTPQQLLKVGQQLFPDRTQSSTIFFENFEELPTFTREIIYSGETFYSFLDSVSLSNHHVFKRAAMFGPGNTFHEIQTRKVQPVFRTMFVTFPMVPFHHVQITTPRPKATLPPRWNRVTPSRRVTASSRWHQIPPRVQEIQTRSNDGTITHWSSDVSIGDLYVPKIEKPCDGYPIQNTFIMDCVANTNLWAFVPIKVVHIRRGNAKYTTFPVGENNRYMYNSDIYSQGWVAFFNGRPQDKRPKIKNCRDDKSGLVKIRIKSFGLNYAGTYSDHVFIDNRQPVASSVSFIAVKDPTFRQTRTLFTAVDQCGIACRPYCLVKSRRNGYPKYEECSGAISLTSDSQFGYARSYRAAAKKVWCPNSDVPDPDTVMYEDDNEIPVVFYCDYQDYRPQKLFTRQ